MQGPEQARSRWTWLKEQIAGAIVNAVVGAILFLVGYGLFQAYTADFKFQQVKNELLQVQASMMADLVKKHNNSVAREGELTAELEGIKKYLREKDVEISELQKKIETPTVPILRPPSTQLPPNPQQIPLTLAKDPFERTPSAKDKWIEQFSIKQ